MSATTKLPAVKEVEADEKKGFVRWLAWRIMAEEAYLMPGNSGSFGRFPYLMIGMGAGAIAVIAVCKIFG